MNFDQFPKDVQEIAEGEGKIVTYAMLRQIVSDIAYRDWAFTVRVLPSSGYSIQAAFRADGGWQRGRKWYISEHATKSEVVQTALKAVLTAEEHEAREHFEYRGETIFFPHFDVDEMVEQRKTAREDHRAEVTT